MISGNSRILLLILLYTFASAAPPAQDTNWDVAELMNSLQAVKSAKAKFVERKHLSILSSPLEFSGTLLYTAPDRLEKHTLLPKAESLIFAGDELTVENKARQQRRTLRLADYPVIRAFVESIRSTLAGDLASLKRYYQMRLEGEPAQWRLTLTPIEADMQAVVSEIRIAGHGDWVDSVETIEPSGDRSLMTISEDATVKNPE